ncbi:hypothetical protein KUCAC02_027349 [Chaenocephalus aceratus]|uniref:Uncharacterized protein n=1 Tax=Chaenocephalus aceratus TaxID=36190 RepID=A0ACB9W440_CHAAC|nr:hypothetical protein KUCAC02_027349 [Chaenocephalus aceratus]
MLGEEKLSHHDAIERASSSLYRFPLLPVRGIPLINHIANSWDTIWAFRPDPSDILIATYPKSGTTWTQEIVDLLLHNGDADACKRAPTPERSPFLELVAPPPILSGIDQSSRHICLFSCCLLHFGKNKCKTIYVACNAKDNMVSYYHFDCMSKTQPEPGPWEGYISKFMRGELAWGSWYDHVKGYWKEREKRNILYLFYEDMKENPRREVERIMNYLDLSLSDEVISRIVELTSFEIMKENPMANYSCIPTHVFDNSVSPFMRKVGDWRNHFTPEQSKMFAEDYDKKMKDVNIPFRTLI